MKFKSEDRAMIRKINEYFDILENSYILRPNYILENIRSKMGYISVRNFGPEDVYLIINDVGEIESYGNGNVFVNYFNQRLNKE